MSKITEEEIKEILPQNGPSFDEVKNYLEKRVAKIQQNDN